MSERRGERERELKAQAEGDTCGRWKTRLTGPGLPPRPGPWVGRGMAARSPRITTARSRLERLVRPYARHLAICGGANVVAVWGVERLGQFSCSGPRVAAGSCRRRQRQTGIDAEACGASVEGRIVYTTRAYVGDGVGSMAVRVLAVLGQYQPVLGAYGLSTRIPFWWLDERDDLPSSHPRNRSAASNHQDLQHPVQGWRAERR
jgi:hypothetical protein